MSWVVEKYLLNRTQRINIIKINIKFCILSKLKPCAVGNTLLWKEKDNRHGDYIHHTQM